MHELEIELEFLSERHFLGVFASDELPVIKTRPCALILNLDPKGKPGSHWCAIYFDENNGGEYYDPLGFPPIHRVHRYLLKNARDGVVYNQHPIQSFFSVSCGEFCVNFVKRRLQGESMCQILSSYSIIPLVNDLMV
jgi:hypothetical protein